MPGVRENSNGETLAAGKMQGDLYVSVKRRQKRKEEGGRRRAKEAQQGTGTETGEEYTTKTKHLGIIKYNHYCIMLY